MAGGPPAGLMGSGALARLVGLWPSAADPIWRALVLTMLILSCGWVNIRGTRRVASVINLFTIGKLRPLEVLIVGGAFRFDPRALRGTPLPESSAWARAILLWVFAFGRWEAILIPAGEAGDRVRDVPRGLPPSPRHRCGRVCDGSGVGGWHSQG